VGGSFSISCAVVELNSRYHISNGPSSLGDDRAAACPHEHLLHPVRIETASAVVRRFDDHGCVETAHVASLFLIASSLDPNQAISGRPVVLSKCKVGFLGGWLMGQDGWWFAAGEISPPVPLEETVVADKSSFTKEEWTLLLESPMMAGMAVTAADPSGLWGLLKESFAGGTALAKAMTDAGANGTGNRLLDERGAERGARWPEGQVRQQPTRRRQDQIDRRSTSGFGGVGGKGPGRCCSFQKLVAPDQPDYR